MKFYCYKKGMWAGAEKDLAMLKGYTKGFELVLTWKLEVLAIPKGGQKVSNL